MLWSYYFQHFLLWNIVEFWCEVKSSFLKRAKYLLDQNTFISAIHSWLSFMVSLPLSLSLSLSLHMIELSKSTTNRIFFQNLDPLWVHNFGCSEFLGRRFTQLVHYLSTDSLNPKAYHILGSYENHLWSYLDPNRSLAGSSRLTARLRVSPNHKVRSLLIIGCHIFFILQEMNNMNSFSWVS